MPSGSPTGWENVGKGEVMEDPYYYADEEEYAEDGSPKNKTGAATAFYNSFKRNFPGNFNIKDLSDSNSQNELATSASRAIVQEAYVDDVFKVLLESVYDVLEAP